MKFVYEDPPFIQKGTRYTAQYIHTARPMYNTVISCIISLMDPSQLVHKGRVWVSILCISRSKGQQPDF